MLKLGPADRPLVLAEVEHSALTVTVEAQIGRQSLRPQKANLSFDMRHVLSASQLIHVDPSSATRRPSRPIAQNWSIRRQPVLENQASFMHLHHAWPGPDRSP